jgi:hypothetical protein
LERESNPACRINQELCVRFGVRVGVRFAVQNPSPQITAKWEKDNPLELDGLIKLHNSFQIIWLYVVPLVVCLPAAAEQREVL